MVTLVKEVIESSVKYKCDVCGRVYKGINDAKRCEKKRICKDILNGLDYNYIINWKVDDKLIIYDVCDDSIKIGYIESTEIKGHLRTPIIKDYNGNRIDNKHVRLHIIDIDIFKDIKNWLPHIEKHIVSRIL